MKTLKIEIPKGFEVESFDQKTGELKFKETPKNIMERIKTFEDVLAHHRVDPDAFEDRLEDMTEDEAAYVKLKLIAESLNEGWKPNWKDSSEGKYYPWFEMNGSSGFRYFGYDYWLTFSDVGSRLCFSSRELAEYAGKTFIDIYKEFMIIN